MTATKVVTVSARGVTRTWTLPTAGQQAEYVRAMLSEPTSLLPGLTALEAASAAAYMRTLPTRRDRSLTDTWRALSLDVRAAWVEQTRTAMLESLR